jgi:hypothetical protein
VSQEKSRGDASQSQEYGESYPSPSRLQNIDQRRPTRARPKLSLRSKTKCLELSCERRKAGWKIAGKSARSTDGSALGKPALHGLLTMRPGSVPRWHFIRCFPCARPSRLGIGCGVCLRREGRQGEIVRQFQGLMGTQGAHGNRNNHSQHKPACTGGATMLGLLTSWCIRSLQ